MITTEQKNIAIAEMLGAIKEQWYPPNKDIGSSGLYLAMPQQQFFPNGERYCSEKRLAFHSDTNWQFEAIEWIEKQSVTETEYASNYNVSSHCFGCDIETTGYQSFTILRIENQNRKEAIFEALYQFSQYLKQKK